MSQSAFHPKPYAKLMHSVFDIPGRGLSPALADSLLALDFSEVDLVRIEVLNGKASEGVLTEEESAELEAYVNVGDLLAYWQSKARQIVRPAG